MSVTDFEIPGGEALWNWFGMSYAAFLVLPLRGLHSMPDEWQGRLLALLKEMEELDMPEPEGGYRVNAVGPDGRMTKLPPGLTDYRRKRYLMKTDARPTVEIVIGDEDEVEGVA